MINTISGMQSQGVQANAKHFIGNEQETHREFASGPRGAVVPPISSNIDDRTMHEVYLWPFADAVRAGVASVMCSYNRLNGIAACEKDAALNAILKEELAFQGYVSFPSMLMTRSLAVLTSLEGHVRLICNLFRLAVHAGRPRHGMAHGVRRIDATR